MLDIVLNSIWVIMIGASLVACAIGITIVIVTRKMD